MFTNTSLIIILIIVLILGWAVWFIFGAIRYVASGDYEVDERLRDISQ